MTVDFPPELEEMRQVMNKIFNQYVEELKMRKVLFGPATKTGLIELQKRISKTLSQGNMSKNYNYLLGASVCAQAIKIQHALELLETQTIQSFNKYLKELFNQAARKQSKGVVKLVAKQEFNYVFMQSNELLAKGKEHPKMEKILELIINEKKENANAKIIIFSQFRNTASGISKKISTIPGIKSKVFVGQASKGTAKGLSQKEQRKIIEDFRENKTNVLCATSIGEEGLDIPEVNTVIFYEPIPSAIRTIQRAGRTARLSKGKLIIMITKGTRNERFFYISRAREKKMKTSIENIKKDMDSGIIDYRVQQKTLQQ